LFLFKRLDKVSKTDDCFPVLITKVGGSVFAVGEPPSAIVTITLFAFISVAVKSIYAVPLVAVDKLSFLSILTTLFVVADHAPPSLETYAVNVAYYQRG